VLKKYKIDKFYMLYKEMGGKICGLIYLPFVLPNKEKAEKKEECNVWINVLGMDRKFEHGMEWVEEAA